MRRRSDAELAPLFGRITPRLWAYVEAVLERIVGEPPEGEISLAERQPSALLQGEHLTDGEPTPASPSRPSMPSGRTAPQAVIVTAPAGLPVPLRQRIVRRIGSSPVRTLLPPTVLLLLVGLRDLIVPGAVRGGDLVPYPQGDGLLSRHVAAWHDSGATLSALDPSPAQLVLGLLQWFGGDAGLRVFVLLAPLLAWSAAMRALRPHLPASLPRTMLSIAYASARPRCSPRSPRATWSRSSSPSPVRSSSPVRPRCSTGPQGRAGVAPARRLAR
jgi:hypothetical protein